MENFKRNKQHNSSTHRFTHRSTSTDGFFVKRPKPAGPTGATNERRQRIGAFSREDGLHAQGRGVLHPPKQQLARQPVRSESGSLRLDMPADQSERSNKAGFFKRLVPAKLPKLRTAGLVLVIALGSFFITSAYLKAGQVFQGGGSAVAFGGEVDPAHLNGEGDGRINILLLGTDDAGGLTDTIIVASIDPIHDEAALLSIPRDLFVQPDDMWQMKINEVYPNVRNQAIAQQATRRQADIRAFQAIQDTVSDVVGIPMHYYVTVDLDGFRRAVDTVGGITLQVDEPVYEVLNIDGRSYELNVPAGEQHFDGYRALAYSRSRKTSPRGDFDRSERQREMLIALNEEILSSGTWSNPSRLNGLFNDFADNVKTSFSVDEVTRLHEVASDIDTSAIKSIELVSDEPEHNYLVSGNEDGLSIQVPRAGRFEYGEIHSFVRNTLRDGYLRSEDASVLVMNGTGQADLAEQTTEELASFGYNVSEPVNAPTSTQRETMLVDLNGGEKKYTKRYLEQRLKTFASSKLPKGVTIDDPAVDFVIIIGQDEITRLQN